MEADQLNDVGRRDGSPENSDLDQANGSIQVDCNVCVMKDTEACQDCLVTYICNREPEDAIVITIDELRGMRSLSDAGLVPGLKHRRHTG